MIYALLTGRKGSKLKDKNIIPVLGRPLMAYPLLAAKNSKYIDDIYVITDSKKIADMGRKYGAKIIPEKKASGHENAIIYGYEYMSKKLKLDVDILVILVCNCGTIEPGIIDRGIGVLLKNEEIDSCATVSQYNEFNPARAKIIKDGSLVNLLEPSYFPQATNDRNSMGDIYFCDAGAWICKKRCMNLDYGELPFRWMGKKVFPLIQDGGLDIHNERDILITEYWLKKQGFTEKITPYDKR